MNYYRDVYLQSDDWLWKRHKARRRAAHQCALCREKFPTLDIHHLKYKQLKNVKQRDLKALCRSCHDKVHLLLEKYPKLSKQPRVQMWHIIKSHLHRDKDAIRAKLNRNTYACYKENLEREPFDVLNKQKRFILVRSILDSLKIVSKNKMKWRDDLRKHSHLFVNPIAFANRYAELFERDPRTPAWKLGKQKLICWRG